MLLKRKWPLWPIKPKKKGDVDGSHGNVIMEVKDYSVPVEETISLVGKSTGMPEATSGGFTPQTVGVG